VLEVEGAKTTIAPNGAGARPIPFQWPSRGSISLSFDPPSTSGSLVADGGWAALKFVASGRLAPGRTPDRLKLVMQQGERVAEFELRAGSVVNPFSLRELLEFRCPQMLP
jgi:type VI secretion system protein ImpL